MTSCLNCGHEAQEGFKFCPKCGTLAPEAGSDPGSILGRTLNDKYRVTSEIGSGAMGTVYLGEHVGLKKKVALKVLHPDLRLSDEQLQRFQREGIAAGKFSHPNAIQIFDFDKAEDRLIYLAMEYVEGSNLRIYLRRKERLSLSLAVRLVRQVLDCLAEAHRHGIIHRDLKPDNLMVVTAARGEVRVKVLDFGLSKLVALPGAQSSLVTQAGRLLGTPLYMSPEQSAGEETDARSDLYAVGLILYELVTGARPFSQESTSDLLFARATQEAPSLLESFPDLGLPVELDEVLKRALARSREERYQSAEEMLQALEAIPLSEGSWGASSISVPSPSEMGKHGPARAPTGGVPAPAVGRGRGWVVGFFCVGLLAAVACVWLILGGEDPGAATGGESGDTTAASAELDADEELVWVRQRQRPLEDLSPVERQYLGMLDLARAGLRTGNPNAARASVGEAILASCADSEAFLVQAEILSAQEDVDGARVSYREALRLDENYVEAHLGLAWLHLERGEQKVAEASLVSARESLESEQKEDPKTRAQLETLESVQALMRGDKQRAREGIERALALDARNTTALLYLGRMRLDAGRAKDAVEPLVQAKLAAPFSSRALLWLAEAYIDLDRFLEAETQLKAAMELDDSAEVRYTLGALLVERGRFEDAELFLLDATRRHASDARLRVLEGLALRGAGKLEAAITALERAVELGAEDEAHLLLGMLNHRMDQVDQAILHYRRTVELLGDVPGANLGLGLALFQRGENEASARHFQLVLDYEPDEPVAHLHLGLLKMDYLGDRAGAREHFERYEELDGSDSRVKSWLQNLR